MSKSRNSHYYRDFEEDDEEMPDEASRHFRRLNKAEERRREKEQRLAEKQANIAVPTNFMPIEKDVL